MERGAFRDKNVQDLIEKFIFVKIDVDKEKQIADKYSAPPIPKIIFLDKSGSVIDHITGAVPTDQLVDKMNSVLSK